MSVEKSLGFLYEGENSKSGDESMDVTTDDECTGQRARRAIKREEIDVTIQKLISKKKSESMFELRKLSHQHHPVSEFNKDILEGLLSSRIHTNGMNSHSSPALVSENVDQTSSASPGQIVAQENNDQSDLSEAAANSPTAGQDASGLISERVQQFNPQANQSPQHYMPEDIRHDMQSLRERQIVHEVLQGPAEEIDRVLREGMEESRARRRPRPRPRPHPHAAQEEDGEEGGDEMSRARARPVGRLMSRSNRRGRTQNRHVHFGQAIPTPDANGRYPVPRRDQSIIVERLRQSPALNSLGVEAREEVVAEVSGLVSRQLVTSALAGEFRGVLELCIQSRAQRANSGQPRPALVASHHNHHHEEEDMSDYREVLPSAEIRELREEMMSIRGQLNELKQMMKLSFDLQLDIQRSIKQEVAAALSQDKAASQNPTLSYGATSSGHTRVVDSGRCVICSEGVIDSVIYHCGHMATCFACGLEMKNKALKCPICRAPIIDVIRAYTSML